MLLRRGFTKDSLPSGTEIVVEGFRAKGTHSEPTVEISRFPTGGSCSWVRQAPAPRAMEEIPRRRTASLQTALVSHVFVEMWQVRPACATGLVTRAAGRNPGAECCAMVLNPIDGRDKQRSAHALPGRLAPPLSKSCIAGTGSGCPHIHARRLARIVCESINHRKEGSLVPNMQLARLCAHSLAAVVVSLTCAALIAAEEEPEPGRGEEIGSGTHSGRAAGHQRVLYARRVWHG